MKRYDSMGFESEHGIYVRAVDSEEVAAILAGALLDAESENARLRSALSWIAVGQGRAGWRGHVIHANEALCGSQSAKAS